MKLARILIKNFLSIGEVEILPGQVNQIVGANNQGKTSILKALEFAFKGSSDGALVKHGETEAEVLVELGEGLTVNRRISAAGNQRLNVRKGELEAPKAQTYLNGLLGDNTFNPLDLLDSKSRTEHLLKCIDLKVTEKELQEAVGDCPIPIPPLDFSQHGLKIAEQAHKYFYQRRAEANKVATDKLNTFTVKSKELPVAPDDLSNMETGAVLEEIHASEANVKAENRKQDIVKRTEEEFQRYSVAHNKGITIRNELLHSIQEMETKIAVFQSKVTDCDKRIEELAAQLKEADEKRKTQGPNIDFIQAENEKIQSLQKIITRRAEIKGHQERVFGVQVYENEAIAAKEFANKLHMVVERTGAPFRVALMSRAALPIEGLTFENDQFYLEGSTIDNLSASKSIKLAVAIARHLASKTKLICLDGAEALDENSYKELRGEIENDGFTYFISKVGQAFEASGDKVVKMEQGAAVMQ